MSEMNAPIVWNCVPQLGQEALTVGEKYSVQCGGAEVTWKKDNLQLVIPEAWKYHFHILRFESVGPKELKFIATSYKTGKFSLPQDIQLTDGEAKISLSPWSMNVASVIQPANGKPPEPHGPFGPFKLEWPMWMWWAIGLVLLLILFSGISAIILRRRQRLWAQLVADYTTALTPYHQFYKDFRRLARISDPVEKDLSSLDEALRLYLLRELNVPTLNRPANWILKYLGKRNPELKRQVAPDMQMILRELQMAKTQKISPKDFEQLSQKCRLLVDKLWEGFQGAVK